MILVPLLFCRLLVFFYEIYSAIANQAEGRDRGVVIVVLFAFLGCPHSARHCPDCSGVFVILE